MANILHRSCVSFCFLVPFVIGEINRPNILPLKLSPQARPSPHSDTTSSRPTVPPWEENTSKVRQPGSEELLRQQSRAIKNQLGHSKPPMASMPGNTFYNYKYSVDIEWGILVRLSRALCWNIMSPNKRWSDLGPRPNIISLFVGLNNDGGIWCDTL